jgi:hypothetical protein
LQFIQPPLVEILDVPAGGGEEAVGARLVGRRSEFAVDAQNGLAPGDEEAGQIPGEVIPLAVVGEEIGVPVRGIMNDLGERDSVRDEQVLRSPTAPVNNRAEQAQSTLF